MTAQWQHLLAIAGLLFLILFCLADNAQASPTAVTPWRSELDYQNLVYGSTTSVEAQLILGAPDDRLHAGQMFPVIENFYYYDPDKGPSGPASILVFENGLLVGLHYRSASNHILDLTYFLINNRDRRLNAPLLGGYRGYFPLFDMYTW